MVNVSKKYLEENLKKVIWESFKKEIKSINTEKDWQRIMNRLFTLAERIMLEKRLAALFLLEQGLSYRKIGEIIDVTPKTVGFVKNGFVKKKSKKRGYSSGPGAFKARKSRSRYPTFTGKGRWRFLSPY